MSSVHVRNQRGEWYVLVGQEVDPVFTTFHKELAIDFAITLAVELEAQLSVQLSKSEQLRPSPYLQHIM